MAFKHECIHLVSYLIISQTNAMFILHQNTSSRNDSYTMICYSHLGLNQNIQKI